MEHRPFAEFEISRLVLGTAQFGLPYGIANRTGRPSYGEVLEILQAAFQAGLNCLDTAALYGESEAVLGKALSELGVRERAVIVTKVPWISAALEERPQEEPQSLIRREVERSLQNLRLSRLPICLFHRAQDLTYLQHLLDLQAEGLIGHVGVSVSSPEEAVRAVQTCGIEAVQIPSSLLDQRFIRGGVLKLALRRGVALFVRSLYLQGLLVLPEDRVPPELAAALSVRAQLASLAAQAGLDLKELALRFMLSRPEVTGLVVGMETAEQLQFNLEACRRGPLDQALLERVEACVPDLPETILNPGLWPRPSGDYRWGRGESSTAR